MSCIEAMSTAWPTISESPIYDGRSMGDTLPHPDTPDPKGHANMPDTLAAQRRSLPNTRESVTHKFAIMGHEGYLTIGLFEDGKPGEVFIKMAKEGSTLSGLIQGYSRALSLALQYGLPTEEAVRRFKGMRFEPMGSTNNPEIPEAMSIIDYVARYLEVHFVRGELR